jgi:AraC-like DNA-binding protein
MLSARNADLDRVGGIEAGADAYLVKPVVSEELKAWVDHLILNRQMLRKAFAQSHAGIEQQVNESIQPLEDNASFLLEFAREVDKQFVTGGKIDMDKIALSFKMGESQLKRKIQTLTGKNVSAYIIQLRMEKAMHLLQESSPETLISTIAEQCGFLDVAYFSRVFRQYYGMTPSQARNK